MPESIELTLRVTVKALDAGQQQIAFTPSLNASRSKKIALSLTPGGPRFVAEDTNAFWRAHVPQEYLGVWDRAFAFLGEIPDQPVKVRFYY
jgi:hypothetical protein